MYNSLPFTCGANALKKLLPLLFVAPIANAELAPVTIDTSAINSNFSQLEAATIQNKEKSDLLRSDVDALESNVDSNTSILDAVAEDADNNKGAIADLSVRVSAIEGQDSGQECKLVDAFGEEVVGWVQVDCETKTFTYDTGSEIVDVTEYLNLSKGFGPSSVDGNSRNINLEFYSRSACRDYEAHQMKLKTSLVYSGDRDIGADYFSLDSLGSISVWKIKTTVETISDPYNYCIKKSLSNGSGFDGNYVNFYQPIGKASVHSLGEMQYTIPSLPYQYSYPLTIK